MASLKASLFLSTVLLLSWTYGPIFGNLTSSKGTINFDTQADGVPEMELTTSGLQIGQGISATAELQVFGNAIISESLVVGSESTSNSNLVVSGSIGYSSQTFRSSGNIDRHSLVFADCSSGNLSLTLPDADTCPGRLIRIKKTNVSNHVIISVELNSGDLIDQYASLLMQSGSMGYATLISLGSSKWNLINSMGTSSSNTYFDVSVLAPIAWYDGSDQSTMTYGAGGNVSIWGDKTGNGYDAVQSDNSKQPTVTSSEGLDFTGGDNVMSAGNVLNDALFDFNEGAVANDGFTIVLAMKNTAAYGLVPPAGHFDVLGNKSTGEFCLRIKRGGTDTARTILATLGALNVGGGTTLDPNDQRVLFQARYNKGTSDYNGDWFSNLVSSGSQQTIAADDFSGGNTYSLTLGMTDVASRYFEGHFYEVIFFNRVLTTTEYEKVEGYLAWKWGLRSGLENIDHSYKSHPPVE
jgi:hypothetical protein